MNGARALLVSAGVTAAAAPLVRRRLERAGHLDRPNHRSSHSSPTPRGGGLACAAGVAAAAALSRAAGHSVAWPVLAGAGALSAVGRLDDLRGLTAGSRLGTQAGVGAVMGLATVGGARGALAGAVVTPLVVNVTNFVDGINGITGMTAALWGLTLTDVGGRMGCGEIVGLGGMTAGAAVGFLPYNVPGAQLFLGDVGSYLFGGLFAGGLLLTLEHRGGLVQCAAPLSVSTADVLVTLSRRAVRGERLTEAHREHAYQRLVSVQGLSHTAASLTATTTAGVLTALACAPRPPAPLRAALALAVAGLYLAAPALPRRPEVAR